MIQKIFCKKLNKSFNFQFLQAKYRNSGKTAIIVNDYDAQDHWDVLTVDIARNDIAHDEIAVKVWSEAEYWVPDVLEAMPNVFEDTGKRVNAGWSQAHIWKIKKELPILEE